MRRRLLTILKWLVGLALLPYALLLVYKLEFVHPVSTLMLYDLVTLKGYDRQWVEFEDISPYLVQSVMMSEDGQFCNHNGVDWVQMNGVIQDASPTSSWRYTLTQDDLSKNDGNHHHTVPENAFVVPAPGYVALMPIMRIK